MCTIVLHPVTHFSFLFLVAVVVVIRYLAERTSRVDWDGIRYTLFGQPVYQHSIYDGLRHRPDKLGLKKPLIWCMSFILVLTGPFMIYVYEPLLQSNFSVGLILGALFFGLGYLAGCGLLDSFTEKMARNFHFEYGTARARGSFGYAIGAFFAGIFFSISPHINFWLVSLFGVVFMMINMRFKYQDQQCVAADAGGVKKEDFIAVFKDRNFWIFVIFIVGTWSFYNIFDQQLFPVFYAGLFESHDVGTRLYGYLNSFEVVLEALCMAIIPFFVNRVGPKNALLIGVVIMALRILSCALFVNPGLFH